MSESERVGPIPPYGVAIHDAISSGDLGTMKDAAAQAHAYLSHVDEVKAALSKLETEITAYSAKGSPLAKK